MDNAEKPNSESTGEKSWQRMWQLFHEAIETDPAERAALLDTACEGDEALRQRIEELLTSHDQGRGILDEDGVGLLTREDFLDPMVGESIGPYRLVEVIGEGGMGIVYEAEQQAPVRRRVALKLIRLGMDSNEVVMRFQAERQALALMTHTTIARVFDGGATDDGRPYFVMELVDGVPLNRFCDDHRLDLRHRLELFVQVCDGIRHAHQRGIIHRDLKPSNVLVASEEGAVVPKIIDFGIAKATAQRLTEDTLYTRMGAWVGTPEYMSPEQAAGNGLDVDTRSDVYSLGVILYQLLSGVLPFDVKSLAAAGISEIQKQILEGEPARPSTRVADLDAETARAVADQRQIEIRSLGKRLKRDLDWITMKALEKNRERRYQSVSELSEDLLRYLDHQPVIAGPPTTAYRLGKFVRRHRAGTAFAATLFVLVLGFAVTMGVLASRIAQERDRANLEAARAAREAQTANEVSDFLVGIFSVSRPTEARGNSITAREILDRGAERVQDELADEPRVQARMMHTIGTVYEQLGLYPPASELHLQALQIRTQNLGEAHPETAASLEAVGWSLMRQADYDGARSYLERALAIQERVLEPGDPAITKTLGSLQRVNYDQGDYRDAELLSRRLVAVLEQAHGPEDARVGKALAKLAVALGSQGRFEEGREHARRALSILERALGPDHPDVAIRVNGLAILNWQLKDYDRARPLIERAVRLLEQNFGAEHAFTAAGLNNLGRLLTDMGDYEAARGHLGRSLVIREKVHGPDHPETAVSILNLGRLLGLTGELGEALRLYDRGLKIRETKLGPDHTLVAMALRGYATVLRQADDIQKATEFEARASAIAERSEGPGPGQDPG